MGFLNHIRTVFLPSMLLTTKRVLGQTLNALTIVLSICQSPAPFQPYDLEYVLKNNTMIVNGEGLMTNTDNVQDMVHYCSNGKASFTADILKYVISIPCNNYLEISCEFSQWSDMADNTIKLHSPEIDLQQYPYRIYILPEDAPCSFVGQGVVGPCTPLCRIWIKGKNALSIAAYFHEIGHNLGLNHAWYENNEYGDFSSGMGYCCNTRCFNAAQSNHLKWSVPKIELQILPLRSFTREFVLYANEYILLRNGLGNLTYVQFRKDNNRYDSNIPGVFANCLNVYHVQEQLDGTSYMLKALCNLGDYWHDYENNYIIIVILYSKNMLKFRIERQIYKQVTFCKTIYSNVSECV
jgi:hypothetical protein